MCFCDATTQSDPLFCPTFNLQKYFCSQKPHLWKFSLFSSFTRHGAYYTIFSALFDREGFWDQNISTEHHLLHFEGGDGIFDPRFLVLCENPTNIFTEVGLSFFRLFTNCPDVTFLQLCMGHIRYVFGRSTENFDGSCQIRWNYPQTSAQKPFKPLLGHHLKQLHFSTRKRDF